MSQQLTGKQNRYLRGLGHHLQPVVMIGRDDISKNVIQSVEEALEMHELIKIKLQEGCSLDRQEVADSLAQHCNAAIAQLLGKTILLFRPSENALITLPKSSAKG